MASDFFHRDIQLFLEQRVDWQRFFRLKRPGPINLDEELDTYRTILTTLGDICADIEVDSKEAWHDEVVLEDGVVRKPAHIEKGYGKIRDAGLTCLMLEAEYGGYGLPNLLNIFYLEMLSRADTSLMTIVGLSAGAALDIQKYGSDELKQEWLPRFVSGEVAGCMDLTEPQAGSDLGSIRTRATLEGDRWFLDGSKIFITNGGAEVHLVLARDSETYDQSKGTTNGLNLLLCPTLLADDSRNTVSVSRVEEKMGLHGSPTCGVEFDHAEAFLLGERGNGFRAMLDLMNAARLGVAAQGLGIAEAAYRQARNYAGERVQFGIPIIQQPLVKSMVSLMALEIESARALLYRTAALSDQLEALQAYLASERDEDDLDRETLQAEAESSHQLLRFLTPLCKYLCTEVANDVSRRGVQVHGGLGFMAESPAAHYHVDSIITTIYEGTSEIQASFALKELGKGALDPALASLVTDLKHLRASHPEQVAMLNKGIADIGNALPAMLEDISYAMLNSKRICDMVIAVMVGTELLFQADASAEKNAIAEAYINRKMLEVEFNARRIQSGDVSRLARYDRILGL
jgi:alkylation response protein AidB-like acyl-CoA dehydrogenase